MSTAAENTVSNSSQFADLPRWDLTHFYPDYKSDQITKDLSQADVMAAEFHAKYTGKLAGLSGDQFAEAITTYEIIEELLGKVICYAQLLSVVNMDDVEIQRFYSSIQEQITEISTKLLFFTLELNKIDDAVLENQMQSAALGHFKPWVDNVRQARPYQLSDELENYVHEQYVVTGGAWQRLFDETMAGLRFPFDGKELTSSEVLDLFSNKDPEIRKKAAHSLSDVLNKNIRLFSLITNTLAKGKGISDKWRKFETPMSSRNLSNQVEDEVVDALMSAVKGSYKNLSHRYYKMKARWLGQEQLEYWDRNAPLPAADPENVSWDDAQEIVMDAYAAFSPKLAEIGKDFFDKNWIDVPTYAGKVSGAFSHSTVPSVHPYILLNYQGKLRDVTTLAHELGHGVHQVLAAKQGALMASTPLTLAETASVFGEMLTFQSLLKKQKDPAKRKELLAGKVEDMLNTVVRQVAFCEFERRVHTARKTQELTPQELAEIFKETQEEALGDGVKMNDICHGYWAYIPHFVHSPFYVYAYAFGDCLVNSLYAVYQDQPEGFEPKYIEMLKAGGTLGHKELLEPFGLDASDPAFWQQGLKVVESLIDQLEEM